MGATRPRSRKALRIGREPRLTARGSASQWESTPRSLLIVVGALLLMAVALYHFGIPVAARALAARVPDGVTAAISDQVLNGLESNVLQPTTLPPERQRQLSAGFERLVGPGRARRYRLVYRGSPELGANALALPSGTIVVTDALVQLARDDREILGVLAHEAGHVEARHGMRQVLQASALVLVVGLAVGDFTSLAAAAPTVLLQAKYSRDFEREADTYAADMLRANGIRPAVLADMLERVEAWERAGRPPLGAEPPSGSAEGEGGSGSETVAVERARGTGLLDYAASHPATDERLEFLRSQ
jgi:Zn-dependent protease with chaperone function